MTCPFDLKKVYTLEPNWPLLLVYSDWLEQVDRVAEAHLIRWLYRWDHWPAGESPLVGKYAYFFFKRAYDQLCEYNVCRYGEREVSWLLKVDTDGFGQRLARAVLPPELSQVVKPDSFFVKRVSVRNLLRFMASKVPVDYDPVPTIRTGYADGTVFLPRTIDLVNCETTA